MAQWRIWNGPMPTSVSRAAVATGTGIKTMLQVKSAGPAFKVLGWGFSGDGAAVAAGLEWELMTSGVIGAVVTAHVAAGFSPLDDQALNASVSPADRFTLGIGATGYTSSDEGVIVATRTIDALFRTPTEVYHREFSRPRLVLGTEYLRIRVKAAVGINALAYVDVEC